MALKKVVKKAERKESLQAIVNHLVENGMSDMGANNFIHLNIPALGGNRTIMNCIQDRSWDEAWNVIDAYLAGDYF